MQDADSAPFEVCDVRYLGETDQYQVKDVCERYNTGAIAVQNPSEGTFIPPWYFDFPDAWYREFDTICNQISNAEVPNEDESKLIYSGEVDKFPVARYLSARLALPKWLLYAMPAWIRELVGQLQSICSPRPKLAHLFLLLLTDFLNKLRQLQVESYEPAMYIRLLFKESPLSDTPAGNRPLGIEDPLNTIRTLCDSLQQLWTHREHVNLDRFKQYRLSSGGILQGRERQGGLWETVISYCGGRIEGKGRCGFAPLILGVDSQCPVCRKLICRHCSYCSESCRSIREMGI
jgi:hypothetical protein